LLPPPHPPHKHLVDSNPRVSHTWSLHIILADGFVLPYRGGRRGGRGLSGLFAGCLVHEVIDAAAVLIPSDCWGAHPSYTSLFLPATLILLITSSTLQCTLHIHPSSFQLHSSYSLPLAPYSAPFAFIPLPPSYTHPTLPLAPCSAAFISIYLPSSYTHHTHYL
jgi:hypothetical protein